jgi:hypothetical protein
MMFRSPKMYLTKYDISEPLNAPRQRRVFYYFVAKAESYVDKNFFIYFIYAELWFYMLFCMVWNLVPRIKGRA